MRMIWYTRVAYFLRVSRILRVNPPLLADRRCCWSRLVLLVMT